MIRHPLLRAGAAALGLALLVACAGGETAAAEAATPASPVRAALAEFDRVCGRAGTRDAYVAAAPGAGWTAFEPAADSPTGRVTAMGQVTARQAAAEMGLSDDLRYENAAFRKTVNGRELILLISLVGLPRQGFSTECRVYDPAAAAPTDAEISAWTQARPTRRMREQGLTAFEWEPGFRPGLGNIAVVHLDPASPLRAQVPVVGLGITSTQSAPAT